MEEVIVKWCPTCRRIDKVIQGTATIVGGDSVYLPLIVYCGHCNLYHEMASGWESLKRREVRFCYRAKFVKPWELSYLDKSVRSDIQIFNNGESWK